MHRHKQGLKNLVVSDEWYANKLPTTTEGHLIERILLNVQFWTKVENFLRATQPLLIALRIADGDETPAAPEITAAMDFARNTITDSLKKTQDYLKRSCIAMIRDGVTKWSKSCMGQPCS
jgi:hypothetical protein